MSKEHTNLEKDSVKVIREINDVSYEEIRISSRNVDIHGRIMPGDLGLTQEEFNNIIEKLLKNSHKQ